LVGSESRMRNVEGVVDFPRAQSADTGLRATQDCPDLLASIRVSWAGRGNS
jgi:hypothetical protein